MYGFCMIFYGLKLSFLVAFSLCAAMMSSRKIFFSGLAKRIITFWMIVLPFVFVIRNEMLTLLAASFFLFVINRQNVSAIFTVVFFIGVLSAVPDWVEYPLSIPGINYLITLTFYKAAVIVLLLPLFFRLNEYSVVRWNLADTLVCVFFVVMTLLTFREVNLIDVLRFLLDSFLIYIVPYFVVSRVVRSVNDLNYCAVAFVIMAVVIAAVLTISQLAKLDIYEVFNPRSLYNSFDEYRGGFLRLFGPLCTTLIGLVMLSGYIGLDILKKHRLVSPFIYWMLIFFFALSILFSGSRGGLFGFILGVSVYWYVVKLSNEKRMLLIAGILLLFTLEWLFNVSSLIVYEDEYGTFDYRAELFKTSWQFLYQYPIFGSQTYLASGYFDHLVTGLGIIDIVSAYLQVALKYGFVGLSLFVAMFLAVLFPLGKSLFLGDSTNADFLAYKGMFFSLNIALMFMLLTTSMISVFPAFIIINLAIGRALTAKQ